MICDGACVFQRPVFALCMVEEEGLMLSGAGNEIKAWACWDAENPYRPVRDFERTASRFSSPGPQFESRYRLLRIACWAFIHPSSKVMFRFQAEAAKFPCRTLSTVWRMGPNREGSKRSLN